MREIRHQKVVLVRPLINRRLNAPFFLPLGLLCVASTLREAGFQVQIQDYEYLHRAGIVQVNIKQWLWQMCEPLLEQQPLIVGLTVLADTMPTCLLMGQYLKKRSKQTTIVIGGPGVYGCLPTLLERYHNCVDYVCINEGEYCLVELARRLAEGEERPSVPGFQKVESERVVDCGRAPLANLDQLPSPAYDMLPVESYLELASPRIFDVYIGSGCTYSCQFCVTAPFWEKKFRSKSPETVLCELNSLNTLYGITQFNFLHDNFANVKSYLDNFIDYFLDHNPGYEWGCAVRPDNVSLDQLKRMRRAGCFNIFCGTDSGSPHVLRAMRKMSHTERSYSFFSNCKKANLQFETNTIVGYPMELDKDLEESLRMIFSSVANGAINSDVSILQPLPGAPVTLQNLENLEFVEDQNLGTFLPIEASELARVDVKLFSGFYFIRNGNREFKWYVRFVELVRFFTRHWFRTLYFLTECCEIQYIDIFLHMGKATDPSNFHDLFKKVFEELQIPTHLNLLARSIYEYDRVEEDFKHSDITIEVENVYAQPPQIETSARYYLLELPYSVHKIFSNLPSLSINPEVAIPSSYLFWRHVDGKITSLRLKDWQHRLWMEMESGPGPVGKYCLESYADSLCFTGGYSKHTVMAAINDVVSLFSQILNSDQQDLSANIRV